MGAGLLISKGMTIVEFLIDEGQKISGTLTIKPSSPESH
jgi:hypothetical protein